MKSKKLIARLSVVIILVAAMSCMKKPLTDQYVYRKHVESKRYSIIYLDLDGTALDTTDTVRESTIEVVKDFKGRGGRIGIATGRTLEQAKNAIELIQPNLPVVLFNGGVIADVNNNRIKILGKIDSLTMKKCIDNISEITDFAYGMILHFPIASIAVNKSEKLEKIAKEKEITLSFRDDLNSISADSLVKILIFCPKGQADMVEKVFEKIIPNTSRVVIGSPEAVEVLPKNINKAEAIMEIANQNAFSLEDAIVFGDSGNDFEMVREAGLGIAMANGRPATRRAAKLILGPNYDDSIAKFLKWLHEVNLLI